MEHRYTNAEWKEIIHPLLKKFYKQSARKKLIQLHRDPPKTSKIQQPWATEETAFFTINGQGIRGMIVSPNGSCRYMEYGADGQRVALEETIPDHGQH